MRATKATSVWSSPYPQHGPKRGKKRQRQLRSRVNKGQRFSETTDERRYGQAGDVDRIGYQDGLDQSSFLDLVDVKKPDGTVENWAVEAGPPGTLVRAGFTNDSLAAGTVIK